VSQPPPGPAPDPFATQPVSSPRPRANDDTTLPPAGAPGRATSNDPADIPPSLRQHPRYRVLKLLGSGGMGAVYLAEHLVMGRRVALKTINASLLSSAGSVARFHREVQAAAKLSHANVVTAHDAEQSGDVHFLVMEFVEGVNLADYVRLKGPLTVPRACGAVCQAALGLQHAHEQGLVHRDIKPANLMLTNKGRVKVLDFGLAHFVRQEEARREGELTGSGVILGTADYIAPEQTSSGRSVDTRADIYSLGCTLYFLLTGRVPFPGGTVIEKMIHHAADDPPLIAGVRRDLPPALATAVHKMMAKRPEDRFQTPGEVVKALRPFVTGATDQTVPLATAASESAPTVEAARAAANTLESPFEGLDVSDSLPAQPARPRPARKPPGSRRIQIVAAGSPEPKKAATRESSLATLNDPARVPSTIVDFREAHGKSLPEIREWEKEISKDFHLFHLSTQFAAREPTFTAVAIRETDPADHSPMVYHDRSEKELEVIWDNMCGQRIPPPDRHRMSNVCRFVKDGENRGSDIWTRPPYDFYHWIGDLDAALTCAEDKRKAGFRPEYLSYEVNNQGTGIFHLVIVDNVTKRDWKVLRDQTENDLPHVAEEYHHKGWRADMICAYADGERTRFVLSLVENPTKVDWKIRGGMTAREYADVLAEEKKEGLFPLDVAAYGTDTSTRYAAIWVRYRGPK
jgi:serine/threonine protein kinase